MPDEEWRTVVNWPEYEVSDHGRVRRSALKTGRGSRPYHVLALYVKKGYQRVHLWRNNQYEPKRVHRLVLEAFIGPCPEGMEGCHNDSNPLNNRLSNLRWDTHHGNMQDFRNQP